MTTYDNGRTTCGFSDPFHLKTLRMNFRLAWQFVLVLVIRVSSERIPEETRHLRKAQYTPPLSTSTYHLSYLARDEIRATAKLQDLAEALSAALDVLNR